MSLRLKILSIVLVIAAIVMVCPQKLEAKTQPKIADPLMAKLGQTSLSMALGLISPALGAAFNNITGTQDENTSGNLNKPVVNADSRSPGQFVTGQRNSGVDVDALIAAAPASPREGLTLVTRQNTWKTQPQNHDEMVTCVDKESALEDGWYGVGIVGEINQLENPYGNDTAYTAFYETFFYVSSNQTGAWSFASDSSGASEIEIDGMAAASWYGEHGVANDWSHNGACELSAGWHRLVYRYAHLQGTGASRAAFKRTGDSDWSILGTAALTLKPVNLDEGILLTTGPNTWTTYPNNHAELANCVETGTSGNKTNSVSFIVDSLYQDKNLYVKDGNYTSYYETFFYADTAGSWSFATNSVQASEIEINDVVVASWYGSHARAIDWSHSGSLNLVQGWHRLVYRYAYIVGGPSDYATPLASAAFKKPGDSAASEWRDLSTAQLTLKGSCRRGTDGDNLPDSVEAVLGTDSAGMDSDGDLLDDYFELKNGLDPLKADSNDDGLYDYFEVNNATSQDTDQDGVPNAWDDDNDNDGVPDSLDASPFAQSVVSDKFNFHIQGDGSPTYAELQIRPENAAHLKLDTRTWDWPDDSEGSMQDLDKSKDDLQISPMLEVTLDKAPKASEVKDYGITVVDQSVAFNRDNPWSSDLVSPGIGWDTTGEGAVIADLNGNGIPDLVLTNINDPTGSNKFRYIIGWDIKADGTPTSWRAASECPTSLGWTRINQDLNQGAGGKYIYLCVKEPLVDKVRVIYGFSSPGSGWTKCDIDLNKGAGGEYIYLWIKNELVGKVTIDTGSSVPDGGGWHKIDKDLNEGVEGEFIYLWVRDSLLGLIDVISGDSSGIQPGEAVAAESGAAIADINGNGKPDLVLMALDASSGPDQLRYIIGWDMNASGAVTSWSPMMQGGTLGDSNSGAGAAIADINGNGKPDLVLMGIDNPNGANRFRYRIGWDLAANGTAASWSSYKQSPEIAAYTAGGGASVADIDGNGKLDLVLTAVTSSTRGNRFEYLVGWDLDQNGNPAGWSPSLFQGWTKIQTDLNAGAGGQYIYLCVKEHLESMIKVISGDSPNIKPGAGWTKLSQDMNDGAGGKFIYLCVRGDLVDQVKVISGSQDITPGAGWTKLPQDLNEGAGGKYIYLCVKNTLAGQFKIISGDSPDIIPDQDILPAGGGSAVADIDGNGYPDLFLVSLDSKEGADNFRYIIGRDMRPATKVYVPLLPVDDNGSTVAYNGKMFFPAQNKPLDIELEAKLVWMVNGKSDLTGLTWGNMQFKGGLGYDNAGGGTAIADINGNGIPDLVLMSIDNPSGANSFRWIIGWDVGSNGQPASWSNWFSKGGLGWENSGGGVAIADINGNGKPDLLLMGIDAASGGDAFNYVIGWDMNSSGNPASWSPYYSKDGLGDFNSGGGAAIADINGNGKPDLLLMGIDNPQGGDSFRYVIGWDLNASGQPASWSEVFSKGGLGDSNSGGGAAIADINGNGRPDLVLMGIDNPDGGNSFRYIVGWDLDTSGNPASWSNTYSKGGLGDRNSGGGAAIADIDGNGIPDLVLMGVDNPDGDDSFWYTTGWNFGTENRTLARYQEAFKLTGFSITENHGSEAGLFYGPDKDMTTRGYLALRSEFLHSQNTLDQAKNNLSQWGVSLSSDIRNFAHDDLAVMALTGDMISTALDHLPKPATLPIAIAMSDNTRTQGMDNLATGSYTLGNSYDIDISQSLQTTMKCIKLPWYNTFTREQLDEAGIADEISTWTMESGEKANITVPLLFWSYGETSNTRFNNYAISTEASEQAALKAYVSQNLNILGFLSKSFSISIRSMLLLGFLGPALTFIPGTVRDIKATFASIRNSYLFHPEDGKPVQGIVPRKVYLRNLGYRLTSVLKKVNSLNPVRLTIRGTPVKYTVNVGEYFRYMGDWAKFMRIAGKVLLVASILLIIGEFIYTSAKSGWTRLGMGVAGLYAAMELIYLGIIIAIACIPLVGWAIALVIMIVDIILNALGKGSGWVMEKIIDALVDVSLRSDTSLDTIDTSLNMRDYEDNGLTSGDLMETSSRIVETVRAAGDGNSSDVSDSYNTPHYEYSVSGASQSGSFRNTVSSHNYGGWRTVTHETGVWVIPQAAINLPLTVWLHSDYKVYYDETIVGFNEIKSNSGSTDSDASYLFFDVLPGSLDEFLSWSAITAQDSDGDNLKDNVEAGTGVYNVYQIINKGSSLSLAATSTTESSQTELAYQGANNQRWFLISNLPAGQNALKASNGKYMKIDPAAWDLGANGAGLQDGLKFYIVDAGNQMVALKTTDGRYITRGSSGGLYPAWVDMLPETRFSVEYPDARTIALKASNGKYVSLWASGGSIANQLRATADSIGATEKFSLEQSGYYQVRVTSDSKVLSIIDGTSTEGAKVTTKTYGYNSDQNWSLESAGGGYYKLVNQRSGLCLGISGKAVNGADAVQETYSGADDQKWKLEPVVGISNKAKWDSDADGLPDGFEIRNYIDYGTSATVSDTDGDGLNDKVELDLGTDPTLTDTDGDNLSDKAEVAGWKISFTFNGKPFTMNVWSDPLTVDSDNDGLTDYQEYRSGLNPRSKDTDGDGILDKDESGVILTVAGMADSINSRSLVSVGVDADGDGLSDLIEESGWDITINSVSGNQTIHVTSNPLLQDTDFDGLGDADEYRLRTNPDSVDTDGDGLNDALEQQLGTAPTNYDTDGDGLDDGSDVAFGSDPLKPDTDNDGLNDLQEYNLGTSPIKADTDDDGLTDLQEVQYGANPLIPDSDNDLLWDGREIQLGTNPLNPDSDSDGLKDGEEVRLGTNPLNPDSDGDGLTDGDEVELWTNPLDADSDHDGLTDFQEVQYGTNPLSADSDNDGIGDKEDPDTYAPNPDKIYVLYDKGNVDYSQFIKGLGRYSQVVSGNLTDIPDYQQKPYVVILGYPEDKAGTAAKAAYDILTDDVRKNMANSDMYRLVRGINIWEGNTMVICLSHPYHSDYYRVLASIKGLKYAITANSVSLTYPEAKKLFFLEAIKEIDFYFNVNLIKRVTPEISITRYNEASTPHRLTYATGLDGSELAVGKYLDINVSDNVQSATQDNIASAVFKIYYTAAELDRSAVKDGDCTDFGDIDENTLCFYRWNAATGKWEKLSALSDVNQTGVNTSNVQPYATAYEGYVWADVGHFSFYALAGKIRQPSEGYGDYPAPAPQPTLTPTPTPMPTVTPLATSAITPAAAPQAPLKPTPAATTTPPQPVSNAAPTTTPAEVNKPVSTLTPAATSPMANVISPSPIPVRIETPAVTESGKEQTGSSVWLIVVIILAVVVVAGSILVFRMRRKPRV